MFKTLLALALIIMVSTSAFGADARPSEKSIQELMRVTNAQKMLDDMMVQVDVIMKSAMQQALKDQDITAKQQEQIDEMLGKLTTVFREEMTWETLEPLFLKVYGDSFTQQELDGMLAFYRTPVGQAVIKKMPLVVKNTMTEMQKRMGPLLEKLMAVENEALEKLKTGSP